MILVLLHIYNCKCYEKCNTIMNSTKVLNPQRVILTQSHRTQLSRQSYKSPLSMCQNFKIFIVVAALLFCSLNYINTLLPTANLHGIIRHCIKGKVVMTQNFDYCSFLPLLCIIKQVESLVLLQESQCLLYSKQLDQTFQNINKCHGRILC